MAVTVSNLTAGGTTSGGTTGTTASVTPSANALVLLTVNAYVNAGSAQPPTPTVTGNGLTWVLVASADSDITGTDRATTFLFRAMGASPSAGAITITFGVSINRMAWVVDQATGTDTSGTNGSGAIVQSGTASGVAGSTSLTATLAAFADATNNVAYGAFGVLQSGGTMTFTAGSGFTTSGSTTVNITPTATEYHTGQDTSVDMSWSNAGTIYQSAAIAIEIAMASAGGTNWTQNVDDSVTMSDTVAFSIGLSLADSVSLADATSLGVGLSINDTVTLADAQSFGIGKQVDDTVTLADAISFGLGLALSDSVSLADAISFGVGLSVGDSVAVADAVNAVRGITLQIDDAVTLSDAIAKGIGLGVDDAITVVDALTSSGSLSLADALTVADHISFLLNGQPFPQSVIAHARTYFVTKFGFYT